LVVETQLEFTKRDTADTDPRATYILYSTGNAEVPVAADQVMANDPSFFGVTDEIPLNVGAVVFAVTDDVNFF